MSDSIQDSLKRLADISERMADHMFPLAVSGNWHVFVELLDPSGAPFLQRHGAHGESSLEAINDAIRHIHLELGWRVARSWAARVEHVAQAGYAQATPDWVVTWMEHEAE